MCPSGRAATVQLTQNPYVRTIRARWQCMASVGGESTYLHACWRWYSAACSTRNRRCTEWVPHYSGYVYVCVLHRVTVSASLDYVLKAWPTVWVVCAVSLQAYRLQRYMLQQLVGCVRTYVLPTSTVRTHAAADRDPAPSSRATTQQVGSGREQRTL